MSGPETEAGRDLAAGIASSCEHHPRATARIAAIEAEARQQALAKAIRRVEGLPLDSPEVHDWSVYNPTERYRDAAVAILRELMAE